jgi:hypothetical protein
MGPLLTMDLAVESERVGRARLVITPYKGRNKPELQKTANRSHAKLREPGERLSAALRSQP